MKIKDILELSDHDKKFFDDTEHTILDTIKVGNFEASLIKHNPSGIIQIGLTSNDNDFTNPESQIKRNDVNPESISSWRKIAKRILMWSEKYDNIKVGSYDSLKTRKYHNILHRILPNISGVKNYGPFCFFEILKPMNENVLDRLINEQLDLIKSEKLNLINECTIAAVKLDDGVVIAKNRDRGYKAKMEVVHEIVDNVEMVYWRDTETDWSEGLNEFGVGIVNSSLLVRQDEEESDKVMKGKKVKTSYDGDKIRHALKQKTLKDTIKSIISYSGEDTKDVGVKGETIVGSSKNVYIVELTSKDTPVVTKMGDEKVEVRTNHGISHTVAGYTHGIKKKSSHMRMHYAKEHLKDVETDQDVINRMKEQYDKNKFFNPYRLKNQYNMSTVGQIMMNLNKKEVTVRMDNKMGEFKGIVNKLPKNYTPKIKIKIESERTHDEKGNKLPT